MRRFVTGTSLVAVVLSLCVTAGSAGAAEVEVLADGQSWAWLNPGATDPRAADVTFDLAWTTTNPLGTPFNGPAPAPLGYGTINAFSLATNIGTPTSGDRFTAYFRAEDLNIPLTTNAFSTFIEGVFDDGGVIYMDGAEIGRTNYSGAEAHFTLTDGVGNEDGTVRIPISSISSGDHTFALSLHNQADDSSDLGFDFRIVHDPAVIGQPVSSGDVWNYLDDGSDQGTAWQASAFDDSGWSSGPSQLGYGDGDEATVTSFGPDAGNKFPTTYFRRDFNVDAGDLASAQSFVLGLVRDDAALVYLNGSLLRFENILPGAAFDDFGIAGAVGGSDEDTFFQTVHDPSLLVAGTNTLAVEIHQDNPTSSDISMDAFLQLSEDALPAADLGIPPVGQTLSANFENNDDDLLSVSQVFDVSGISMLGVTAELRTWQTSTTFESGDFASISVEVSLDGINFAAVGLEEVVNGTDLFDFDSGLEGDNPFLDFTAMFDLSELVNQHGVIAARVILSSDTDSGSEHIEFGNFSVVPEPSSIGLALLGLVGLAGYGWRRRRA
jgi:hypothetical protein